MRDTNHLVIAGQLPQLFAHYLSASPTDTGIDFVKNQRWRGISRGKNGFQGQHQARCFTAGSNFGQWLKWLAWIGGNQELHAVDTRYIAGIILLRLVVDADRYPAFIGNLLDLDGKAGAFHIETIQLLFHGRGQVQGRLTSAFRELLGDAANLTPQFTVLLLQVRHEFVSMHDGLKFGTILGSTLQNLFNRRAIFALKPGDKIKPL